MKLALGNFLKKPKFLLTVSIIFTILVIVAGSYYWILPRFLNWRSLVRTNEKDSKKLEIIKLNISKITSVDQEEINSYGELFSKVVPTSEDSLRVVSILDGMTKNSDVALETVEVVTKKSDQTSTSQAVPAATKPTATSTIPGAAETSNSYKINATFHATLPAILDFITSLNKIQRAMSVSSISLAKAEAAEKPVVNLEFYLPLSNKVGVLSAEQGLVISSDEETKLDNLMIQLTIDASPSNSSLGKINPF